MENDKNVKEESQGNLSRRDFLKYSAGVAAVAAGASAMLAKLPLPSTDTAKPSVSPSKNSGPIIVAVNGDELTVMSGQSETKVRDPALAAEIASRAE